MGSRGDDLPADNRRCTVWAGENRDPAEHAEQFLKDHAILWKMDGAVIETEGLKWNEQFSLRTTGTEEIGSGCSHQVTFQLWDNGANLPVFNAGLRVSLGSGGVIKEVVGRLSGDAFELDTATMDLENAAAVVRDAIFPTRSTEDIINADPAPIQLIVDPFFVGDEERAPALGWSWDSQPFASENDPTRWRIIVNQSTNRLQVAGPAMAAEPEAPHTCSNADPTEWFPEVVMDDFTTTPAFVGLRHFGGLYVEGVDWADAALSLIERPIIGRLYGTASPSNHLRLVTTRTDSSGRVHVVFEEVINNVPVDGSYVVVTINTTSLRAESINSRFVYRPEVNTTPTLTENAAKPYATNSFLELQCGSNMNCISAMNSLLSTFTVTAELVVLSGQIHENTTINAGSQLAWRFRYPGNVIFSSAKDGTLLYSTQTHVGTAFPWAIQKGDPPSQWQIFDGGAFPGVTVHANVSDVNGFIVGFGNYLDTNMGHIGMQGDAGWLRVYVHSKDDAAAPDGSTAFADNDARYFNEDAPINNTSVVFKREEILLGRNMIAGDVVAHEMAHGINQGLSPKHGLGTSCQPRIVSEHISDVFGEAAFPSADGGWDFGESTIRGVLRNMSNPTSGYGYWPFEDPPPACPGDPNWPYLWTGAPNRAAVLMADGFDSRPGLGRLKVAKLYYAMMQDGKIGAATQMKNLRVALLDTCKSRMGAPTGLSTTVAECDLVRSALQEVGLFDRSQFGVQVVQVGWSGDTAFDATVFKGQHLYRGCTLSNQTLIMHLADGTVWSSDWNDSPELEISEDSNFGVYVTHRGSATDSTDREISYHVYSHWYGPRWAAFWVEEDYNWGTGVTSNVECQAPPGKRPRTLWSAPSLQRNFTNWSDNVMMNTYAVMPTGCEIESVSGLHWDHPGSPYGPTTDLDDHVTHGYNIIDSYPGTPLLCFEVHGWIRAGFGLFFRANYNIFVPDTEAEDYCDVPGATMEPVP